MDETVKEKKHAFIDKLKLAVLKIGSVFKDYPVTMGCIVVIAAIAAVIIDCDFDTDLCEKIILFLAAFAVQALFTEEYFAKKPAARIAGYVIAAPISAFLVYLANFKGEEFLGMPKDKADEIFIYIYISYFVCLICASLYHMYKRQQETFESYCLKTFCGLIQTTVVYGLFAGGLAIIVLIFDNLIFDTDSFLGRVEIFLAGGIYVPALLLVLSGKKPEVGKFVKICVLYVLEPMLILAMAIIYIYIIKIFVSDNIPSNSVFGIISCLFATGMVIWTLACGIGEDNFFCRAAKILPFVFIPCIILQAWSILIRIGDYGFTPQRYLGVMIVIFELIYMVFYFIRTVWKKDSVALIMWVAALMVVIGLIVPYLNYASVCVRSQSKRLEGITVNEQLKDSELAGTAGSAFRSLIYDCGWRGEEAVDEMFTASEQDILRSCYSSSNTYHQNKYYLDGNTDVISFDISEYRLITKVNGSSRDPESAEFDLKSDYQTVITADLSQLIRDVKDYGRKRSVSSDYFTFDLDDYGVIVLDEKHDLKLTTFSTTYNSDNDELEYMSINGYLLEK